jgi:broad specificity phosphatase PhoE
MESPGTTTILLVRHGHVPGITPKKYRGRIDLELTERGVAEALKTADWIARHRQPLAVYTSPLKRCRDTGAAIAARCNVRTEILPALNDLDYGKWQGRTHEEVAAESPELYECWRSRPQLMRIPGGESLQELVARAADSFRLVARQHPRGTVVMVGHESVNRALLLQILDQPLSAFHTIAQDPCAINEICLMSDRAAVMQVNQTAHLETR